jgi:hypothetical protein
MSIHLLGAENDKKRQRNDYTYIYTGISQESI